MKKRLLVLSALVLASTGVYGQQDPLVTHFIFNKMTFNPGSTGIDEGICGTLMYRNQWDKVNGAPNSAFLNVEANLDRFISSGVGVSFVHDAIGFNRQNNVMLNYSFHRDISSYGTLGAGVGLGLMTFGLSPVWVPPVTLIDATLPASSSAKSFDANFGLYWKGRSAPYYIGISSTHLAAPSMATASILGAGSGVTYNAARHYYVMGGYKFANVLANGNGSIDVQALVKTEFVKTSVDINVRYLHKDLFYGGITYRTSDAVAFMAGITIQKFLIGYSYDLTLNKLSSISRGSHEVVLKYCYYLPVPPRTVTLHPRYL